MQHNSIKQKNTITKALKERTEERKNESSYQSIRSQLQKFVTPLRINNEAKEKLYRYNIF